MSSLYSIDLLKELSDGFEEDGYTTEQVKALRAHGRLRQIKAVLEDKAEIVMKKVEETVTETVTSILTFVKNITTSAVATKLTSKCFTSKSRYYYRDTDIDAWLPKEQPAQPESTFAIQMLYTPATFKRAVENFLGITGDINTLARTLKERGHVTTLPTVDFLIEKQETGEDVGLRTDGYANFFFVEDNDGSVSVVYVGRYGRQWDAHVRRLDNDYRWRAGHRFFFHNSDTESL